MGVFMSSPAQECECGIVDYSQEDLGMAAQLALLFRRFVNALRLDLIDWAFFPVTGLDRIDKAL